MKHLGTIILENATKEERNEYRVRHAARAIVRDNEGKVAILHVTKHNYHKLPGGGVKEGEDMIKALYRECLEEIGCDVELTSDDEFMVDEYRDKIKLYGVSNCYIAKVKGEKGQPSFTEKELANGFEIVWVDPSDVIALLENDRPDDYEGPFIQKRDMLFLKAILQQ